MHYINFRALRSLLQARRYTGGRYVTYTRPVPQFHTTVIRVSL